MTNITHWCDGMFNRPQVHYPLIRQNSNSMSNASVKFCTIIVQRNLKMFILVTFYCSDWTLQFNYS